MKIREIAQKYNVDEVDFDRFIMIKNIPCKKTFSGTVIADQDVEKYVSQYREWRASFSKRAEQQKAEETQAKERLEHFKLTTSCSFEGYVVEEYIDVLFDEILVGLGFGKSFLSSIDNSIAALTGTEATTMIGKLNEVKAELKQRLMEKAARMGANAMLGIDFESSKIGDLIMVSMTGTAVKISKIPSQTLENQ